MAHSTPITTGNQISWPNDSGYQVQNAPTYEQVCTDGQSCEVKADTHYIINHTTGERFTAASSSSGTPPKPSNE